MGGKKLKTFGGSVLFLDRSDINTDEIILDEYLKELPKQELKAHLFEKLEIEGAYLITIEPFEDERGTFSRRFCKKEFEQAGFTLMKRKDFLSGIISAQVLKKN